MNVQDTLTGLNNQTEMKRWENRVTGTTELGQDAFLQLLMTQLKYQDPLNPMSNDEFMMQQAQFTQISELQKLNDNFANQTLFMESSSLIGKTVGYIDPDNPTEVKEGKVTEAKFNGEGTAIVIDGKDYALESVVSIKDTSSTDSETDSGSEQDSESNT